MKLLLVEDDHAITLGLEYSLEKEGYEVWIAANVKQALALLETTAFDLALVDLGLPDGSGFDVCRKVKEQGKPLIFLTAVDEETYVVKGLDMGGDDYVTKPFRLQELLSRIRSVLRRYQGEPKEETRRLFHLRIDLKQAKVYHGEQEIYLSAMEYRLLLVFLHHQGQVLTRAQLLDALWDNKGQYVENNTLSVTMRRLREKIERDPQHPCIITTVRGLGYRMEVDHAA